VNPKAKPFLIHTKENRNHEWRKIQSNKPYCDERRMPERASEQTQEQNYPYDSHVPSRKIKMNDRIMAPFEGELYAAKVKRIEGDQAWVEVMGYEEYCDYQVGLCECILQRKILEIKPRETRKECIGLASLTHSTKGHKMSEGNCKIWKKKGEEKWRKSAPGEMDRIPGKIMAGKRVDPEVQTYFRANQANRGVTGLSGGAPARQSPPVATPSPVPAPRSLATPAEKLTQSRQEV